MIDLFGINIQESPYAVRPVPNKRHTHRRNQSAAYHKRIQKKWRKRFGTHDEPAAFFLAGSFGKFGSRDVLMMHPKMYAELRTSASLVDAVCPPRQGIMSFLNNSGPVGTRPGVKTIYTPVKVIQPRQQGKTLIDDLLTRFDARMKGKL